MTLQPARIIWVTRDDAERVPDEELRRRAGIDGHAVIEMNRIGKWGIAEIPAGARSESGDVLPAMSVGFTELPPEGRVFVLGE